ncbi:hypothetical protein FHS68_000509 [Dyadobacter arcticus]|uniref:Uncharacterized protein n=1 Tax=Dyadobacter arcticus TaxID=1078754 RepID=A0ABX0UED4_9BACT|nr:hypothetical protein [Dyadobacter arcticus]
MSELFPFVRSFLLLIFFDFRHKTNLPGVLLMDNVIPYEAWDLQDYSEIPAIPDIVYSFC